MIAGHKRIVLWFSGGKDSMACLYLLKGYLKNIDVLWVNTGKYYPEMLETVAEARKLCPRWHEIKTNRDAQWEANGMPSDVVPIDHTIDGQVFTCKKAVTIQSYLQCCFENIAEPLMAETKRLGATLIVRGQRREESHRANAKNATMLDGIQFWHPIEDWNKARVMSFLKEHMKKIPEHYALEHSSMDCYDCTAYAAHSQDRAKYTRKHHPELFEDYQEKMGKVYDANIAALRHYLSILYSR